MFDRLKSLLRNYLLQRSAYRFFIANWLPGDAQRAADVMATMRFSGIIKPAVSEGPSARRVTVLAPHPDDEIIGLGGTLIAMRERGADVTVIYVTDGAAGAGTSRVIDEAQAVADRLGYRTRFLGLSAGCIRVDAAAAGALAAAIIETEPQVLFVPFMLDDTDDHRRANELLLAAGQAGRLSGTLEVWAYQVYSPLPANVLVDISRHAERKADAIRMFDSQMQKRDWAHFALGLNAFNLRLLRGASGPRYVETFFVLPLGEYLRLCEVYFGRDPSLCYSFPYYRPT